MDIYPLVAVIIPNRNRKRDILECLQSVRQLDYPNCKIVVVDNDSSDGAVIEIKTNFPEVHLIEHPVNSGAAGGRNIGIKYAREKFGYKYLLFLDNDSVIERNALREMVKSFDDSKKTGIVTPKCYRYSEMDTIEYAGGMYVNFFTGVIRNIGAGQKDTGQYDRMGYVSASGGLFLIKKEAGEQVGWFDERFNPYGWEDVDFSLRVKKLGYNILYNSKAVIYHKGGKQFRTENVKEYEVAKVKNYFYLLKKHTGLLQWVTILLLSPLTITVYIALEMIRGKTRLLKYKILGLFNLFK